MLDIVDVLAVKAHELSTLDKDHDIVDILDAPVVAEDTIADILKSTTEKPETPESTEMKEDKNPVCNLDELSLIGHEDEEHPTFKDIQQEEEKDLTEIYAVDDVKLSSAQIHHSTPYTLDTCGVETQELPSAYTKQAQEFPPAHIYGDPLDVVDAPVDITHIVVDMKEYQAETQAPPEDIGQEHENEFEGSNLPEIYEERHRTEEQQRTKDIRQEEKIDITDICTAKSPPAQLLDTPVNTLDIPTVESQEFSSRHIVDNPLNTVDSPVVEAPEPSPALKAPP